MVDSVYGDAVIWGCGYLLWMRLEFLLEVIKFMNLFTL